MSYSELPIKIEGIVFKQVEGSVQILLLKRSEEDGGFWQPLTGTLEFDESLNDCLVRELQEETGLTEIARITPEVYRFHWEKKSYMVVELVYGIEVPANAEVVISHEHEEFAWLPFDEALERLAKDNNKKAFIAFRSSLPEYFQS